MFSLSNCCTGWREWPPGRKLRQKADRLSQDKNGIGWVRAEGVYQQALAQMAASPVKDNDEFATCLGNFGDHYLRTGRCYEAIPLLEQAEGIRVKLNGPDAAVTFELVRKRAECYRRMLKHKPYSELLERLLKSADVQYASPTPVQGELLRKLFECYQILGERDKLRVVCERLISYCGYYLQETVAKFGEKHEATLPWNRELATYNWQCGNVVSTRRHLEAALAVEQTLVWPHEVGNCPSLGRLALLNLWVGDHESGRPLADKALGAPYGK